MNYEEFIAKLLEETQVKLKELAQVEVSSILQNNGIKLTAFTIFKEGEKITPNIYIDAFYEKYQENIPISVLAEDIVSFYCEKKDSFPELGEFLFEWEERKKDIFYRVINHSKNKTLLTQIPHVRFLDLAVVFYCMVYDGEAGIGSIRITNEHKYKWEIHTKDLMEAAEKNTPRLFPVKIQDLGQALSEMLLWEDNTISEDFKEEISLQENVPIFYIITNDRNINGASVILYPHLLSNFANQLQSDLYILPSSIHEIIVVPIKDRSEEESLKETVQHINQLFVIQEEVLSDHVYYYSRENHTLEA